MNYFVFLDRSIFLFIQEHLRTHALESFFWFVTCLGLGYIQAAILIILSFFVKFRRQCLVGLTAFAASGLISTLLKHLIARDRPNVIFPQFATLDENIHSHSFPSGHTITSFAISASIGAFLTKQRQFNKAFLLYFLACMVGYSRVYRAVHWPSDVLTSAILGTLIGLIIYKLADAYFPETHSQITSGVSE